MYINQRFVCLFLVITLLLISIVRANAAPSAELWPRWQSHDAASPSRINHNELSHFISKYLKISRDGIARFAYGTVSKQDEALLTAYVIRLSEVPISSHNRREQFAYWVNLYNALTVKVVLANFPIESIRDINISPGWFSNGPWGAKLIIIESEEISLNDIEHRILRPIWKDPRIHYVINCASLGCPNIPPVALTAKNTEKLLNKGALSYINHPRGVTVKSKKVTVSSIYIWFQADFGGNKIGVLNHLKKFATPKLKKLLEGYDEYHNHAYQWNLNSMDSNNVYSNTHHKIKM